MSGRPAWTCRLIVLAVACASLSLDAQQRTRELRCRGGELLLVEPRGPIPESGGRSVRLSLIFSSSRRPAGVDNQGLDPGTCSWIDEAFEGTAPQVWFVVPEGSPVPQLLRDPTVVWAFHVIDTGRGHFDALAHERARMPPAAGAPVAAQAEREAAGDPVVRIVLAVFGLVVIGWLVMSPLVARWTGWRRLARAYPASAELDGERIMIGLAMFRHGAYRNVVSLRAGRSHLHFRLWFPLFRLGHPPFSIPWSEVSVQRDPQWWYRTMVRFTFAREPEVPLRVVGYQAERIVKASGGRLQLPLEDGAPARSER